MPLSPSHRFDGDTQIIGSLDVANALTVAGVAVATSSATVVETPEPYCTDYGLIISGNAIVANHIRGMKYRWPKSGSVTGLGAFVIATAGNCVFGVYDTAVTNLGLLATTATAAAGANNTFQAQDFTTPLTVVAGTDAYLVIHSDNTSLSFGRTAALANNASQGPFPTGFMTGADALLLRSWDFNRASYSAPLPSTIATASCSAAAPIVIYVKYA